MCAVSTGIAPSVFYRWQQQLFEKRRGCVRPASQGGYSPFDP